MLGQITIMKNPNSKLSPNTEQQAAITYQPEECEQFEWVKYDLITNLRNASAQNI